MQELILELLDTTLTIEDVCDELEIVDTPELVAEVYEHISECDNCGMWTNNDDLTDGVCPHCLADFEEYLDDCDD